MLRPLFPWVRDVSGFADSWWEERKEQAVWALDGCLHNVHYEKMIGAAITALRRGRLMPRFVCFEEYYIRSKDMRVSLRSHLM
jgi:hypothetical protein